MMEDQTKHKLQKDMECGFIGACRETECCGCGFLM